MHFLERGEKDWVCKVTNTKEIISPLKVFILEDDGWRIALFQETLEGCDLTVINSCEEYEKFTPPYDVILLDHDLGDSIFDGDGNKFLSLIKDKLPLQSKSAMIVVHSWNPEGAQRMCDTLKASGLNTIRWAFSLGLLEFLKKINEEGDREENV